MPDFPKIENLPKESQDHLAAMVARLLEQMEAAGGSLSFAQYMEEALYAPGLGYYTAGLHKFGASGDFVTAPEISPLFGQCLAKQISEVLRELGTGEVLEVGAGSGALAVDLLKTLETLETPPNRYLILEVSADLRARQYETISTQLPTWIDRVVWISNLPESGWEGVIVANELLDAMPVHCFEWTGKDLLERRVTWEKGEFTWVTQPLSGELAEPLGRWHREYGEGLEAGYSSEIGLVARAWVSTIAKLIGRGAMFLFDYGYPGREYYHPLRNTGTLACHYRHHRHYDPLIIPGLQDITSHVDFTAMAKAAVGLEISGYTTQAHFLLACGICDLSTEPLNPEAQWALSNQIRLLTFPQEMGELFKVLALTRGLCGDLMGFRLRNLRDRL